MKRVETEYGISPVMGSVILIAISVMITAIIIVFFTGLTPTEPSPTIKTEVTFYTEFNQTTNESTRYMKIRHLAGDKINISRMSVLVTSSGYTSQNIANNTAKTEFRPGDTIIYNISSQSSAVCGLTPDDMEVVIADRLSQSTVTKEEVDVKRGGNAIVLGNTVTATTEYKATITVLGIGASASNGGRIKGDIIHGRIKLNYQNGTTQTLTPWPDSNPNDSIDTTTASGIFEDDIWTPNANGITYTTKELGANTTVSVDMRSYKPTGWAATGDHITRNGNTYEIRKGANGIAQDRFWVNSNNPSENNLVLLKDGDQVPALGQSLPWQQELQQMLQSRMNATGHLQLDSNEVVAVYELNTPDASPGNAGDYNDAVVLIKVQQGDTVIKTETNEKHRLYCRG